MEVWGSFVYYIQFQALHFALEPGYVPFASKKNYYSAARMLGRDLNDFELLERSICLKLTTGLFENVLTGFDGEKVEMTCELNGIGCVTCFDKKNPTSKEAFTMQKKNSFVHTIPC